MIAQLRVGDLLSASRRAPQGAGCAWSPFGLGERALSAEPQGRGDHSPVPGPRDLVASCAELGRRLWGVPELLCLRSGLGGLGGLDGLRVSEDMVITVPNRIVGAQDSPGILVGGTGTQSAPGHLTGQCSPHQAPTHLLSREERRPSPPPDGLSTAVGGAGGGERAGLPSPRDPAQ